MANLVELIKQAAVEAVNASNPAAFYFGTVTSDNPLSINVEQKMDLTSEFLILTNAVKDHVVEMTVDHTTENVSLLNADHTHEVESSGDITVTSKLNPEQPGITIENEVQNTSSTSISAVKIDLTHKHSYKGRKKFTVHNALKKGEKVVMIKLQGGQKFVVLDRV